MNIFRNRAKSPLILTAVALAFLAVFVLLPLVTVFVEALSKGVAAYGDALTEPDALSAIRLTLIVAAISVPLNIVFGIVAAWAIAKFDFPGKSVLITFIDLPFSVVAVASTSSQRWCLRSVFRCEKPWPPRSS